MTLVRLLADQAARNPARPALAFEGERISYAELDRRAARAAGALHARGVEAGDHVLLRLSTNPASVAALHGVFRLGAVAVPLNPLLAAVEIEERERRFGVAAHDPEELDGVERDVVAAPAGSDTAVVLFTSGTTGEPKRVELTHAGLRRSAEYLASEGLGLRRDDVLLGAAPLSHVFGLSACLNASMAAGACLALLRRFDGAGALDLIEAEGVSVFLGVPTMCAALLAASRESGQAPSIRLAHIGGAPLQREVRESFAARFDCEVLEGYGMTEAGGAVTLEHAGGSHVVGSVGTPAAGARLRIAGDGEVLVSGPGLARGLDGWFATGDVGRLDDAGRLFLLDRKKSLILRGGYSISPQELEAVLRAHPQVADGLVVGVPHPTLGEEVAALVVPETDACDPEDVKQFVRSRVAAYKYPRSIELVDELPVGPTGKVDRLAARQLLVARRSET